MSLINRNERGKLQLQTLNLQMLFDDIIDNCKTNKEVAWVREHIEGCVMVSSEDKLRDLGVEAYDEDEDEDE